VFVDVEPDTLNIDPMRIAAAITPKTRAILAVHLYGHPADLDPILETARRHGVPVLEDACQAHGARYKGQRVGRLGAIGAFSFYPTKNLGAFGDAGAVVTDDRELAESVRRLRQYGWEPQYCSRVRGTNSRLDELQAAVLRVKLARLDESNAARRRLAERYTNELAGSGLQLPRPKAYVEHVFHLYVVRSSRRDELHSRLRQAEIEAAIHYPIPVHLQPAYADLVSRPGDLTVTERSALEVLSLPLHPAMTDEHVGLVCAALHGDRGDSARR
jgi:dTDP-4-amino-4,6-dideoxygalactose transaminase